MTGSGERETRHSATYLALRDKFFSSTNRWRGNFLERIVNDLNFSSTRECFNIMAADSFGSFNDRKSGEEQKPPRSEIRRNFSCYFLLVYVLCENTRKLSNT